MSVLPCVPAFSTPGAITNRENFNKKMRYIQNEYGNYSLLGEEGLASSGVSPLLTVRCKVKAKTRGKQK